MHHCLNIHSEDETGADDNFEEALKDLGKTTGNENNSTYFFGLFGKRPDNITKVNASDIIVDSVF